MKNFLSKTRENFPRNSQNKSVRNLVLLVLLTFLLLFTARDIVGTFASFFTTPLYFVRHYIETSTATVPVFVRSRIELLNEMQKLEAEVALQQSLHDENSALTNENNELRDMLHASSSPRIVAGVISRPPYTPYDTLMIDRGSAEGIIAYAPVYHGKNLAIGYVRNVFSHSALVTLFSSPSVESSVYIYGPNLFTSAYGEGGGILRLSVPQGVAIEKGNIVVMPSLDMGIIGSIQEIQSIPTEPEQHAYVLLDVPMQSVRLVSVGTAPIQQISYTDAVAEVAEVERTRFTFEIPPDAYKNIPITPTSTQRVIATTSLPMTIPVQSTTTP